MARKWMYDWHLFYLILIVAGAPRNKEIFDILLFMMYIPLLNPYKNADW